MPGLPEKAEARRSQGAALFARGLYVAAAAAFEEWLEIVEPSGHPNLILPPLNALASVALQRNEYERVLAWLDRALPYADDPRADPLHVAKMRVNRLAALVWCARDDEVEAEGQEALAAAERAGVPYLAGRALLNLSSFRALTGDWIRMRHEARTALTHLDPQDDEALLLAYLNLGIAHLELGALRLAERDLRASLRRTQRITARTGYVHTELGRLARLRGDYAEALASGSRALAHFLEDVAVVDKAEVARVSELFGDLFAASGDRNLALKYLNRSAAYYSQLGHSAGWQRVMTRIGEVLPLRGRALVAPLPAHVVQPLSLLTAVLDLTDDIECVDPHLRGHSERVAQLAGVVGRAAGLAPDALRTLLLAARLHDVGKVAIDVEILRKAGPLTEQEWERVRLHPAIGAEMLRAYDLDPAGLEAIRHHHEHWDGSGYPAGLRGEAIPLLARILAVADVYDALTSDRAYRPAHRHEEALRLMEEMAGRELDPDLVDLFLGLHRFSSTGGEWR
ncbi:HD-GYP domain-containing protein [Caldinitratiruptor microaerophilus]|uniref:HD-GYP domain-containing protein n=1 Tax=Caldinitratiruptor microaerophilus TaxID=671077 RepID=A0AA35CJB8_9FIRM|nr:HD-GYP domain-containing protein [Caldinitratiruptor microaerophilus]BDG59428.1 hypothetical protein caldi_05180 [Caldinitratiruptor microaerophilus]